MARIAAIVVAAVLTASVVSGQTKPYWTFAGKWTTDRVVEPNSWGKDAIVAYPTPTTLRVVGQYVKHPSVFDYRLDGRESKNTITAPDGTIRTLVSKATWVGEKLRIVTATPTGDEVLIIYREGIALMREQVTPARDGRPAVTTRTVYTKS